jgi:hypothetical protein
MSAPQSTLRPAPSFLGWPGATDPEDWRAEVAVCGILHGEPYARMSPRSGAGHLPAPPAGP